MTATTGPRVAKKPLTRVFLFAFFRLPASAAPARTGRLHRAPPAVVRVCAQAQSLLRVPAQADEPGSALPLLELWDALLGQLADWAPEARAVFADGPGRGPGFTLMGFQGREPCLDARGAGTLALRTLAHAAINYAPLLLRWVVRTVRVPAQAAGGAGVPAARALPLKESAAVKSTSVRASSAAHKALLLASGAVDVEDELADPEGHAAFGASSAPPPEAAWKWVPPHDLVRLPRPFPMAVAFINIVDVLAHALGLRNQFGLFPQPGDHWAAIDGEVSDRSQAERVCFEAARLGRTAGAFDAAVARVASRAGSIDEAALLRRAEATAELLSLPISDDDLIWMGPWLATPLLPALDQDLPQELVEAADQSSCPDDFFAELAVVVAVMLEMVRVEANACLMQFPSVNRVAVSRVLQLMAAFGALAQHERQQREQRGEAPLLSTKGAAGFAAFLQWFWCAARVPGWVSDDGVMVVPDGMQKVVIDRCRQTLRECLHELADPFEPEADVWLPVRGDVQPFSRSASVRLLRLTRNRTAAAASGEPLPQLALCAPSGRLAAICAIGEAAAPPLGLAPISVASAEWQQRGSVLDLSLTFHPGEDLALLLKPGSHSALLPLAVNGARPVIAMPVAALLASPLATAHPEAAAADPLDQASSALAEAVRVSVLPWQPTARGDSLAAWLAGALSGHLRLDPTTLVTTECASGGRTVVVSGTVRLHGEARPSALVRARLHVAHGCGSLLVRVAASSISLAECLAVEVQGIAARGITPPGGGGGGG